ncbi:MAG: hypothetical protein J6B12_04900 [Clostridia bacterium]|nr:hypothetical protein [Clostridia bacterium]
MAKDQNKLSKREKRKILITRIVCSVLALLMVGGVAYYALLFLLPAA